MIAPRVLHLALCGSSVSLEKLQGGFLQESPSNSTTLMSLSRSILADIADAVREDHASIAGSFKRLVDDVKSAFSEKLIYHSRPVNYLLGSPVHSICRRLENTQPPCLYMRSLFDKFHVETLYHVNNCVHYKQELKSPLTKTHALDQLVAVAISNTWVSLLQLFREEIDVDQLTQEEDLNMNLSTLGGLASRLAIHGGLLGLTNKIFESVKHFNFRGPRSSASWFSLPSEIQRQNDDLTGNTIISMSFISMDPSKTGFEMLYDTLNIVISQMLSVWCIYLHLPQLHPRK